MVLRPNLMSAQLRDDRGLPCRREHVAEAAGI